MTNPEHTYTDDHVQTIAFQIPDDVKDIGINLSGGANSAVIAFAVFVGGAANANGHSENYKWQ